MAAKVELNFELLNEEEFGPVRLQDANMYTLLPDFNEETLTIRKLLLSGKFKNTKELFKWLLPFVDKIALKAYLNKSKDIDPAYFQLYDKMTVATCACFETFKKAGIDNAYTDSTSLQCLGRIWADTALMKSYRNKLMSLSEDDKVTFLNGLIRYSQINCPKYFDEMLEISLTEMPGNYDKQWQSLKAITFLKALHYHSAKLVDSLQLTFPAYKQFLPQLQQLEVILKKCTDPKFPFQPLTEQPGFDRYATFVTQYTSGKPHIFAQAVFEIGTDKLWPYVKKVTIYSRENLQNIERLEQSLPPLPKN